MLSAQGASAASSEVLCARSAFPGEFGGAAGKKIKLSTEKLQVGGLAFQARGKNPTKHEDSKESGSDGHGGDDLFLFKATPLKCVGHLLK